MYSRSRSAVAPKVLSLSLVLLAFSILASGCAHERFKTRVRVDASYDFSSVKTFAFDVRREKVANSPAGKIVHKALRKGLVARGYEEVPKDEADVLFSYDVGVYAFGGLSGANSRTRQQGDITVWVFDRKTGENILYGWAETALRASDEPEPTINAAVDAIFQQRPPRDAETK